MTNFWRLLAVTCLALLSASPARALTPLGLWYDRYHSGHGLDLHRAGDQWFGTLYTYGADGAPLWLWLQGDSHTSAPTPLFRYTRRNGQARAEVVGAISLQPLVGACADALARPHARLLLRLRFELDGLPRDWCIEPLLPEQAVSLSSLNGAWYNPLDPGWGLLVHFYGSNGAVQTYQTVYYYDGQGLPRWAFDQAATDSTGDRRTWYSLRNECLDCPGLTILAVPVGSGTVRLTSPHGSPGAPSRAELRLDFDGSGAFVRNADLMLLSDPVLIPPSASTGYGRARNQAAVVNVEFRALPFAWRSERPSCSAASDTNC